MVSEGGSLLDADDPPKWVIIACRSTAQLSRYELAALFYNVMGRYSSSEFNKYVIEYDLLNGLYSMDLFYQLLIGVQF